MRRIILFGLIALLGCQNNDSSQVKNQFFDLSTFTKEVIANMVERNSPVRKKFILDGKAETKTIERTDSVFWANELKTLLNIDLNAPKYIGVLDIKEGQKDISSNLLIDRITSSSDKVDLVLIEIYYLDDKTEVRKLNVQTGAKNFISDANLDITAWFNRYGAELLVDSVITVGKDKVLLQNERNYESHLERIRQ